MREVKETNMEKAIIECLSTIPHAIIIGEIGNTKDTSNYREKTEEEKNVFN